MKIVQTYRQTAKLLGRNLKAVVQFEILYKLFTAIVATPLFLLGFKISSKVAGLDYISNDTIKSYFMNPVTILFLFLILIGMTFVVLLDIEAMIQCMHASYYDKDITVTQMFRAGVKGSKKVLRKKNWLMMIFVLLIIPLTNVAAVSGYASTIKIPGFIQDFIRANGVLSSLVGILFVVLILVAFCWAFSIHTFTLEDENFKEAHRKSRQLMKGNYLQTIVSVLVWEFVLLVIGVIVIAVCAAIAFLIIRLTCAEALRYSMALFVLYLIIGAVIGIGTLLSVPLVFANLSTKYYEYKQEKGQNIPEAAEFPKAKPKSAVRNVFVMILCVALLFNGVVIVKEAYTGFQSARTLLNRPGVGAHRGSSMNLPENSMPAFRRAIEEQADWIELDVHQTKDGVVVVTHDEDIKRIAGVDKKVWELTYEELQQYDVGSWFSDEFKDLRVATLDEVVKLCKDKIKIQIELKPTGHEENFEQNVIDVIKENDFADECVFASLNADALKRSKELAPDIKTLYIMAVAIGEIPGITFADGFSIEASFINTELVDAIHNSGKDVCVWTINRQEDVEPMVAARVDVILSDDPVMINEALNYDYMNSGVGQIVRLFFDRTE